MKIIFFTLFTIARFAFGDVNLRRNEDSDVKICDRFDICGIVHKPYWGNSVVEKLCKCPKLGLEEAFCRDTFSQNDGFSLAVNRRTQMKFCSPIRELQAELNTCAGEEVAIKVRTVNYIDQVKNVTASILCNCDYDVPTYWKFHSREGKAMDDLKLFEDINNFQCSELKRCNANEFCGLARSDYGFLFQRCTCDATHNCIYFPEESEAEEGIDSELFYSGLMYKSRCIRNETLEHW